VVATVREDSAQSAERDILRITRDGKNSTQSVVRLQVYMSLAYQLLALDPNNRTRSEDALSLLFQVRGFTSLWKKPKIQEADCKLVDGDVALLIVAATADANSDAGPDADHGRSFIVTLTGTFELIEGKRERLAALLKDLDFELLYVLKDEASEHIACQLYPYLYRTENLLRGYLIRFMATRIGPSWWELTASTEMTDKAKMRKKNERVFGKHIENSAFLIDFDELGEIVYKQSSGFLTREDIVARVSNLSETPDAVRALKQELRSNYDKLFKEAFADKGFKDKWTEFETLRNKIAHNNLFTAADLSDGKELATSLIEMISAADAEAKKLVISTAEREAIKEQVAKASTWSSRDLTDAGFLEELDAELEYAKTRGLFVGLTFFTNNRLLPKGYGYASCQEMIERLRQRGDIEVYYVENPSDPRWKTAALRRAVASNSGEPDGPANGSQPIRSATVRPSSVAGSRR
jgi:hypothetical protein